MGYTHYFTQKRKFTNEEWDKICEFTKKIIEHFAGIVQFESDNEDPPQVDENAIRFNGIDSEGHETFMVTKSMPELMPFIGAFRCCKTARKSYDDVVCLVLLAIHSIAPDAMDISSDGDWDAEWIPSQSSFAKLFPESGKVSCPWEKEEEVEEEEDFEELEGIQIPVSGRFGPNRGNAKAVITCDEEDGSLHIRIDDANNLEFWAEFTIDNDIIEQRPKKKIKQ